jgi:peptidoglycan/LPS O-acetylase OafA/YrhL
MKKAVEARQAKSDTGLFTTAGRWLLGLLDDEPGGGKRGTIAVLDGVRAFAVLIVIVFHVNRVSGDNLWDWRSAPLTSAFATAGGMGVTLFFVLSGFLLFMPFSKWLLFKTRRPLVRVYYMRRIFRIVPAYYFSLYLLIVFGNLEYFRPDHRLNLMLFLTFFMDSYRPTFRVLNGPYWTLATEWQFYMILPLLCLLFAGLLKLIPVRRRLPALIVCLLGVIAWGLAVRYWGFVYLDHPNRSFLFFPPPVVNVLMFFLFGITGKYTEDFAVGMLLASLYIYAQDPAVRETWTRVWQRLSPWLWRVGWVILVFSVMWHFESGLPAWPSFFNPIMPYYNWLSEMILAVSFGLCIAAVLYGSQALQGPFTWRPVRWIARISYSLYIWHLPFLVLFQTRVLPHLHLKNIYVIYLGYWLWAVFVLFPFCVIFYNVVEKPFMRLGDYWRKIIEKKSAAKLKAQEKQEQKPEAALSYK